MTVSAYVREVLAVTAAIVAAKDHRVTVEFPFSRLHLDAPPRLMVPVAVEIKSPRKIEHSYRGRRIRMPKRQPPDSVIDTRQPVDTPDTPEMNTAAE